MMPDNTCSGKGLSAFTHVFQIYAVSLAQQFSEFLRGAQGIDNLSKLLHSNGLNDRFLSL
jgi:hypothetical protein